MKKYLNLSLYYAIAAMIGGVFYREFTKMNGYTGVTTLGKVHAHLFILGMIMFLIIALYAKQYKLEEQKTFRMFMIFYNIGLIVTALMLVVRGIPEVLNLTLSAGMNGMISGIAGLGHISLGVGMILLIVAFKKSIAE